MGPWQLCLAPFARPDSSSDLHESAEVVLAVRGDQLLHLLHNAKMLRVHMLSFHSMLPKTVAQSFSGGVAIYVVYFRFCG